jgi:hypothetical protein
MNEPTNAPMLPPPSGVSEWVSVWRDAITRPSDQTYARIAQSPNAKLTTALLWVFLSSLVSSLISSLPGFPAQTAIMREALQSSGLEQLGVPDAAGGGLVVAITVIVILIWVAMQVILFVVITGVIQLIAKMFGGRGTFEQLAYALAAIITPFYLIGAVFSLLSAIPFVVYCVGILGLALLVYVLVLEVIAVKGVNQFGWGPAIGSLLLPVFAVVCCLSVAVGSWLSMSADILNSITTPMP